MNLREAAKDVVRLYLSHNHPESLYTNEDWFKAFDALWEALKSDTDDTALLRQALDCLENHVMQRTYASGVVICNIAIALRERLGETK